MTRVTSGTHLSIEEDCFYDMVWRPLYCQFWNNFCCNNPGLSEGQVNQVIEK
jgi:hypothetical protein